MTSQEMMKVAEDALYADGVASGKKEAKDTLFDVETTRFLTDVLTAAGLLYHGKTDKALAQRISDGSSRLREKFHAI